MTETSVTLPKTKGGVVAYLTVEGATKAAEFYKKAFGATQEYVFPPDDKGRTMHVHLYLNGTSLMLGDPYPEHGHPHKGSEGFSLVIPVKEGIDAVFQRAVDAGCKVEMPLADMFWGDRYGQLRDPFGVSWAMNQPGKPG